jgi:hypothetical protein
VTTTNDAIMIVGSPPVAVSTLLDLDTRFCAPFLAEITTIAVRSTFDSNVAVRPSISADLTSSADFTSAPLNLHLSAISAISPVRICKRTA